MYVCYIFLLTTCCYSASIVTDVTRVEPRRHQAASTAPNNFISTSNPRITGTNSVLDNTNNFAIQTITLTGDLDGDANTTDTFSFDLIMSNNSGADYNHGVTDDGYILDVGQIYTLSVTNPSLMVSDLNMSLGSYSLDFTRTFSITARDILFEDVNGNTLTRSGDFFDTPYRISENDLTLSSTNTSSFSRARALGFTLTINTIPEPSTSVLVSLFTVVFLFRRKR